MCKLPKMVMGICHGKTEGIFYKKVISDYITLKIEEINQSTKFETIPVIKRLANWNDGYSITINGYKNDIQKYFFSKNRTYNIGNLNINSDKDILFISIIDINEREEVESRRISLIDEENHKVILGDLLEASNLELVNRNSMFDSVFIYFNGAIEKCLPNYVLSNNKEESMHRWTANNIHTFDEYTTNSFKEFFSVINSVDSNISMVFDYIDKMFENFLNCNCDECEDYDQNNH